ncbi:MAG: hypothetical protein NBV68_04380 [Erythrobacter sp.]|uniref:hypothetical protein n=1 Tax=Erythrobacter sp. TaxID=1042 RepID=UPI0025ECE842|nr:hypothetical protein [Erythrobacter sp.]MCL9998595.1 hypothetical protein [Erythrobacter sp.]
MSYSPHSLDALSAIDFDDGLVVVNAAGEMRVYNELAALLWHALREGHPQDVLLEDIERVSGTAARAAAADVIRSWHAPPPPPVRSGAGEHTFPPAGRQIARYAAMPGGLAIVIHAPRPAHLLAR